MLRAAALKDFAAGIAPAPFVERTHAWPRPDQTELICGMFGIGTPPFDAALNCARTALPALALMFAGGRPFAAASCVWPDGEAKKLVTRSLAAVSTLCAAAYFVTIIPWTPRNGTEGFAIAGTCTTLNEMPAFVIVSAAHGPVIQNGVVPLVKAVWHSV